MKVINLTANSRIYTSNVYFVRGTWNAIEDVNTLVDVGRDPTVIEAVLAISTGVGKKKVDQVILTHSHYDHATLLPAIRATYDSVVYAYSSSLEGVDHMLRDGEILTLGDRTVEVIHMPGHRSDSVCLYCEKDEVLFSGDSSVFIGSTGETYEKGFTDALERICSRNIRIVYPGHGRPITEGCRELLAASLRNIREAKSTAVKRRASA